MVVYIDTRGSNEAKLAKLLADKSIPTELKHIESGDVVIINDKFTLGIERKTVSDLLFSIKGSKNSYEKSNRHLFPQLETLKATYKKTLLIIEDIPNDDPDKEVLFDWTNREMVGTLLAIEIGWQIPVILTESLECTAERIAQIYTKYGNYKVSSMLPPAVHKAKSTKDIKISMLCTVEGIGIQTAKKLYEKEPLLIGTPLGEEYVNKILKENLTEKPRERLKKVLMCGE